MPSWGARDRPRATGTNLVGARTPGDWDRPTECPADTVKRGATDLQDDDLSVLSRQREAVGNTASFR